MNSTTLSFGGAVVLALNIYAIYNVMTSRSSWLAKIVWTVIVLLMPILGFIIWILFGPRSADQHR